ncbi:zinc finger, C3HC4 type domain-containing protein [Reticulomyxa filosa]|uniref:RING-type E3 ubiquitin transferase n=1 Tax=Reticulomyxa filosa TaxID=46433 RepID=X6NX04_RETFI|nr:zinc finger, C3HC4 type domain-containing protein [Reticulomyxa filosa]|eukprot:ETO30526.1 zinc finger, C3HC4 type domain-containing protein [Reticulomyxa filosa]
MNASRDKQIISNVARAKMHLLKNDSSTLLIIFSHGIYDQSLGVVLLSSQNFTYWKAMHHWQHKDSSRTAPGMNFRNDTDVAYDEMDDLFTPCLIGTSQLWQAHPNGLFVQIHKEQRPVYDTADPYYKREIKECPIVIALQMTQVSTFKKSLQLQSTSSNSYSNSNSNSNSDSDSDSKDTDDSDAVRGCVMTIVNKKEQQCGVHKKIPGFIRSFLSLQFVEQGKFLSQAANYWWTAFLLTMCQCYILLRQWSYATQHQSLIKLSLCTLFLQSVYSGIIFAFHFYIAINVDALGASFLMVATVCLWQLNMDSRNLALETWESQIISLFSPFWQLSLFVFFFWNSKIYQCLCFQYHVKHPVGLAIWSSASLLFSATLSWIHVCVYLLLFSDWTFQIFHNARKDERHVWSLGYAIGITVSRLFFPLCFADIPHTNSYMYIYYIYICIYLYTNTYIIYVMDRDGTFICFVSLKTILFNCVHIYNTHKIHVADIHLSHSHKLFFIPRRFKPTGYTYHRAHTIDVDTSDESEDTMDQHSDTDNITTVTEVNSQISHHHDNSGGQEELITGSNTIDNTVALKHRGESKKKKVAKVCAICFDPIKKNAPNVMVTPCDHVFHDECLLPWMKRQLTCPTCRQPLPEEHKKYEALQMQFLVVFTKIDLSNTN